MLRVAGIDRLITMDLHADQIQGFFDVPVDHLYASGVILPYLQSLKLDNIVIASPDVGGSKRANTYAKYLGCPLVLCNKTRARANVVESMQIIGDVKDKNVVIIDDMVDTAGTITKAADIMKEAGAKSVRACASHCVMSGPASERIQNSALEEMVFTDSIPYSNRCAKVKQPVCGRHVRRDHTPRRQQREHQFAIPRITQQGMKIRFAYAIAAVAMMAATACQPNKTKSQGTQAEPTQTARQDTASREDEPKIKTSLWQT